MLAIVACAGLLSAVVMTSAHHAVAQEAEGSWNADGSGSEEESSPETRFRGFSSNKSDTRQSFFY
jgi:hypothetical protein